MAKLAPFETGQRVALDPSLDDWMRGDRYGVVVAPGRTKVTVRLDRSGRVRRDSATMLTAI